MSLTEQFNWPEFRRAVLAWYRKHGRQLPWRNVSDPYAVWVSEIMLQQTQVSTVLGHYSRFLKAFPTVADLAKADEAAVLKHWQGLGYYRRARNLHAASKVVEELHGGRLPEDPAVLQKLPGLGRYTANAILSFSLGQKLPILEANTVRLWTRILAAKGDPGRSPLKNRLWSVAEQSLPRRNAADFNQALMDLGAEVCTPKQPSCDRCPVRPFCLAAASGTAHQYPQLPKRTETVEVDRVAVVMWSGSRVLIQKRPADGRWGNMWEFPTAPRGPGEAWEAAAERVLELALGPENGFRLASPRIRFKHGIMHYRVSVHCFDAIGEIETSPRNPAARWVELRQLDEFPFSSPQRQIVDAVTQSEAIQPTLF